MKNPFLMLAGILLVGCSQPVPPTNTDWSTYLGDNARRHYTTLDQITRENVATLKLAWKYDSGELRGSRSTMYTSPLVVDGVLYGLSPKLVAFALDAASGTELWRYDPDLPQAQRGLMWWRRGEDRRLLYTAGSQLLALNADDGTPVETFGEQGRVDLTPKVPGAYIGVTVPGVVFEDLIIVGFATNEDASAYPGSVRAFDAVDGSLVWQFDTIPAPGAPGSQTWAEGSLEKAGGANVWSGMALDEARGILFAPTGSATPDFYGADRLGDNLFANCLLAINARTGELIWHYQIVRHDLWDRDNPSPPTLVQLERDGRLIDAVALTTKSGHLYVFDRVTGESIYPITEVTTLPSTMPGEVAALSQPVSAVAFSRQQFEITDRSEEAAEHVSKQIEGFDLRPWAPPQVGGLIIHPWYDGGAEWGGSAFDPSTRRLILNAQDVSGVLEMFTVPVGSSPQGSYMRHCGSCHGQDMTGTDTGPELTGVADRIGYEKVIEVVNNGSGRMPGFAQLDEVERRGALRYILSPVPPEGPPTTKVTYAHGGYSYLRDHDGLPGNTPPWGTLNSIDLATGESRWQVPFGNYPAHPDLGLGAISYGGPVVTASGLIFIAATPDRKIRAYNSDNAEILWEAELSAAGFSTPAIYSVAGKQYVVIAAGGGRTGPPSGAEYFAFSLP